MNLDEDYNSKKIKIIFGVLIIIILILLTIYITLKNNSELKPTFHTNSSNKLENQNIALNDCLNGGSSYPDYTYFTCKAVGERNINICDDVEGEGCNDWIIFSQAYDEKDISLCEKISNNNIKKLCLTTINQNPLNCDKFQIPFEKSFCKVLQNKNKDFKFYSDLKDIINSNKEITDNTFEFLKSIFKKNSEHCIIDKKICEEFYS